MTFQPSSFAILGAGLMGRLAGCVIWPARATRVESFRQRRPAAEHAAAPAAGAMLAPLARIGRDGAGVVRMGLLPCTRWPELLAPLTQPVFFQQEGTLVVWHRQDDAEAQRLHRQLEATQSTPFPIARDADTRHPAWHTGARPGPPF